MLRPAGLLCWPESSTGKRKACAPRLTHRLLVAQSCPDGGLDFAESTGALSQFRQFHIGGGGVIHSSGCAQYSPHMPCLTSIFRHPGVNLHYAHRSARLPPACRSRATTPGLIAAVEPGSLADDLGVLEGDRVVRSMPGRSRTHWTFSSMPKPSACAWRSNERTKPGDRSGPRGRRVLGRHLRRSNL